MHVMYVIINWHEHTSDRQGVLWDQLHHMLSS